ncbi:MAG: hypothetical protein JO117_08850 [Verrucomicrobia bacterium]|nr:hypothetical protein [Verrucomicrobiota bacterium]
MKTPSIRSFVLPLLPLAVGALLLLPSAQVRSQMALPPSNPAAALQALQTANADLIKRQEATLKELEEATNVAREARIFARRS